MSLRNWQQKKKTKNQKYQKGYQSKKPFKKVAKYEKNEKKTPNNKLLINVRHELEVVIWRLSVTQQFGNLEEVYSAT